MARTIPHPRPGDESEYVRAVEELSRDIHDPVDKLRFLRGSLADRQPLDRARPAEAAHAARSSTQRVARLARGTTVVLAAVAGAVGALALVVSPAPWRLGKRPASVDVALAAVPPPEQAGGGAIATEAAPPPGTTCDAPQLETAPPLVGAACGIASPSRDAGGPQGRAALAQGLAAVPAAGSPQILATDAAPPASGVGVVGDAAVPVEADALVAAAAPVPALAGTDVPAAPPPAPVEQEPLGMRPSAVWLVEAGPDWEQYSNGLRIETGYAVEGEKRHYRVFTEAGGMSREVFDRPVGILFHTTESHVWPLEAAYNENLRDSSQGVVQYVSRERLYHYLIDRFGRVYRAVQEDAKANHAGHSIWQNGEQIYLNLNHAFLGVSFETRWAGGKELPLTEAQLTAGRNLTAWLRQRWSIPPEMCVGHGLTSVNPRQHLIGYHLDWARGFPFAAFGLPDQYRRIAPSVLVFGFGYDRDFLDTLDVPWEGVREAERALAEQAARLGVSVDGIRRERRALYDRWAREQSAAEDESQRAEARPTSGGS